jgi:hypothetical protein
MYYTKPVRIHTTPMYYTKPVRIHTTPVYYTKLVRIHKNTCVDDISITSPEHITHVLDIEQKY